MRRIRGARDLALKDVTQVHDVWPEAEARPLDEAGADQKRLKRSTRIHLRLRNGIPRQSSQVGGARTPQSQMASVPSGGGGFPLRETIHAPHGVADGPNSGADAEPATGAEDEGLRCPLAHSL